MILVCSEAQHGSVVRRGAAGLAVPAAVAPHRGDSGDRRDWRGLGGGLLGAGWRVRLHRRGRVPRIELLHHGDALERLTRCTVFDVAEDGAAMARVQSMWTSPLKIRLTRFWVSSTV